MLQETTRSDEYRWPPRVRLTFLDHERVRMFCSTDRDFDLSDNLMRIWVDTPLTVFFRLATSSTKWIKWDEKALNVIEELIEYDLNFDAFDVGLTRMGKIGSPCAEEFEWRLNVSTSCD